jgi:hypothetical protein
MDTQHDVPVNDNPSGRRGAEEGIAPQNQRRVGGVRWGDVSGRRLLVLVIVLGTIGIPAAVLQAACVGRSCDAASDDGPRVPFCGLPSSLKRDIANGYREGRSPDVLAVSRDVVITTDVGGIAQPWPRLGGDADTRVPIAFWGRGIAAGATVPDGTTLDAIAPTIAAALGFDRPFPEVRSGNAIGGVADGNRPDLVVIVAWKGVGGAELGLSEGDAPFLETMLRQGAGTLEGRTGSLPIDPAATMTTIGTGGLPSQHGITGSFVRNDRGDVVEAFGDGAPVTVIATLADDLDAPASGPTPGPFDQRSVISLVETGPADRGMIGGTWYEGHDEDQIVDARGNAAVAAARSLLATNVVDDAPDVLAVALDGSVRSMDRRTREIALAAERSSDGSALVVVAGTGPAAPSATTVEDSVIRRAVEDAVPGSGPAIAATVPGGSFLDQGALERAQVTGQVAVDALLGVTDDRGGEMLADAFQGFAVSFARYC